MTQKISLVVIAIIPILFAGIARHALAAPQQQGTQQQSQQPVPPATKPQQPAAPDSTPPAGAAPQGAPRQDSRARISARTDLVIVPVTVKDHQGQLVGDLQREEFRVFEDNVEQKIVLFANEPFPLSAVVLIDDDLSQKSAEAVQKSLTAIAAGFGPSDEVALVTYDQFQQTIADFSFSNDQLFTELKRLDLGSHFPGDAGGGPMTAGPVINGRDAGGAPVAAGATQVNRTTKDLDDAVFAAATMLKGRGRLRRKIIFLISDGNNSRHNAHSFDQTMQQLLAADVSVYSISVGHALLQHETGRLEHYANGTGGDAFFAGKQRDLERLYSAVTEQARNEYTLTFSPEDIDRTKDYHTLEVRVRRPDLSVSARQGYYEAARRLAN
jgi:VWFA-related protein